MSGLWQTQHSSIWLNLGSAIRDIGAPALSNLRLPFDPGGSTTGAAKR
jgi:hypothetical protein